MIVAVLYNIADRIFIGWSEAGTYGNAATNIVYPVTVFALGFALPAGDGASANFSIFPGAGNMDRVKKCIGYITRAALIADVGGAITASLFIRSEIKKYTAKSDS